MSDYQDEAQYMRLAAESFDSALKQRALEQGAEHILILNQQLEQAQARVVEQRNMLDLFIKATQKAEVNGHGQDDIHHDDSWIDALGAVLDYAMRQLTSKTETAGGSDDGN